MLRRAIFFLFLFLLLSSSSTEVFRGILGQPDNRGIVVDGLAEDWEGIKPIYKDPKGDSVPEKDEGSDLKEIYVLMDENHIYFMIDFYGPANRSNLLDFYFNSVPKGPAEHFMFGESGFISWSESWGQKGVKTGYDEVAEVSFPLQLFRECAIIYINPGVYLPSDENWGDGAGRWVPVWIDEEKGVDINYDVDIHEKPRLIEVEADITNLENFRRGYTKFRFYQENWHHSTVVNITFSTDSRDLDFQSIMLNSWRVKLPDSYSNICIRYFLNFTHTPAHSCYFSEDFVVAHTANTFVYPESVPLSKFHFHFKKPDDWVTATHWKKSGDEYSCEKKMYIQRGFYAIGKYEIFECNVDDVKLLIAVHRNTMLSEQEIFNYSEKIFRYFMDFTHFPFQDLNKFLIIFAPPPSMCGTADYGGPSCTVDSSNDRSGMACISHEMFHILDGFSGGILEEGFTQYYGYKGSLVSGLWDNETFYKILTITGNEGVEYYYTDIWNSEYNLAITSDTLWELEDPPLFWVKYRKPAIVAYMLDSEIMDVTDGNKSLDDVISYLNMKYCDPHHYVSPEEFLETVNSVSGSDFTPFFDKYIYGDEWLPPVPVKDWLDHYITMAERRVSSAEVEDKTGLESKITSMKNQKEKIIQKISQGDYSLAFTELEETIDSFKETLEELSDETPPTIKEISYESEGVEAYTNVTIKAQCSDYGCGLFSVYCCYTVNNGNLQKEEMRYSKGRYELTIPGLIEGDQVEFYIQALDKMGNENKSREHVYKIPGESPEIEQIEIQPTKPSPEDRVKVKARITDKGTGVNSVNLFYSVASEEDENKLEMDRSGSNFSASIPENRAGEIIRYYIVATDNAGSTCNTTTQSYKVKTQLSIWLSSPSTIGVIGLTTALIIVLLVKKKL